jgi:hypothetical protein
MAITYVNFQPSNTSPFIFSAVLDGVQYNISVTWNFVNIYSQEGTLILCAPMVGSPTGYDIDIVARYFTSTLVFRTLTNNFEISSSPVIYNPVLGSVNPSATDGGILDYNFILDESTLG